MIKHFKASVAAVLILLSLVVISPSPVWADQAGAATAISSAKATLLNCYNAAKQAEAAGANITVLVDALNEAGPLLSQAELAYDTQDFDEALNLATQSQAPLNNFVEEANVLGETARQQREWDFSINVIGSTVGAFAVIFAGVAVWVLLKRKYETPEAP